MDAQFAPAQPSDIEAEKLLIGSILRFPDDFVSVSIEPDDFFVIRHREIWQAMRAVVARRGNLESFTVAEELTRGKGLEDKRSEEYYLAQLEGAASTAYTHDTQESARVIRDMAQRRAVLELAGRLAKAAFDQGTDIQDAASDAMRALLTGSKASGGAKHWEDALESLFNDIEERSKHPQDVWGIATGFPGFDRLTGGLQTGELLILSGEPAMGKSMLAMQMGEQMAACEPGAIYSAEMSEMQVTRRILSSAAKVRARAMKSGRLDGDEWQRIVEQVERLRKLPVYLDDPSGIKTSALQADLARLKAQHNIKWFIFDYLMLAGDAPEAKEWERTGLLSRSFKLICHNLDLAGVVIHSMNKSGVENATPGLSNLRGSAQVGYDADIACMLTEFNPISISDGSYTQDERQNMRTLLFIKGRDIDDPNKYIHLVKDKYFPRFGELAEREPRPAPSGYPRARREYAPKED